MRGADRLVARRRRWVLATWLVLFAAATPLALHQTDHLVTSGALVPGSQSQIVDAIAGEFPNGADDQQGVLLSAAPATPPRVLAAAVRRARAIAGDVPNVVAQLAPRRVRPLPANLVFVPLTLTGDQDRRVDAALELRKRLGVSDGPRDGVTAYVIGQDGLWAALNDLQKSGLQSAEQIGLPVSLVILLFAFGALAAAMLPVALAAVTVTLTGAAVYLLSLQLQMSIFVTNAASMVGIGVAIDYSLFVLARYRQEIAAGRGEERARREALRTSGEAVVFSGLTVVVALCGIFLVDLTLLRSMAIGMIVVVGFSVAGAVTLTPALIDTFGSRVYGRGRLIERVKRELREHREILSRRPAGRPDFWSRWTSRVTRRPLLSALAAAALMLVLGIPLLRMDLVETARGQIPPDDPTIAGATLAARYTGPGRPGPIKVLITFRDGPATSKGNLAAQHRYVASVRARPQVASVDPALQSADPRRLLLTIVQRAPADAPEARELVASLREQAADGRAVAGADVLVGGAPALPDDFVDVIRASLWKVAAFIVLSSYLVLLFMLRSLLLPLKAIVMTALSVAASYGVLVAVFQWGWLDGLLGYDSPGYVDATAPPLLLAVVFGLSMDYEVLLLSRIREHVRAGHDTRTAVARGLRASAGTITSAALIMVSVFAVFVAVGLPSIKQLGAGLAVAIALDATVVRLVLVPATMDLMGRWNWWLPGWLDRVLPATSGVDEPATAARGPRLAGAASAVAAEPRR